MGRGCGREREGGERVEEGEERRRRKKREVNRERRREIEEREERGGRRERRWRKRVEKGRRRVMMTIRWRRSEGTYSHVRSRPDKGISHGVDELPTHPKITQLNLTSGVDQDVGWLHI